MPHELMGDFLVRIEIGKLFAGYLDYGGIGVGRNIERPSSWILQKSHVVATQTLQKPDANRTVCGFNCELKARGPPTVRWPLDRDRA